ncbi:MAG: hypothetical protein HY791_15685 [Deltaproteobacteria bacterium]|nr:hypothetical protein [Deltaproteobacteria bacterium]
MFPRSSEGRLPLTAPLIAACTIATSCAREPDVLHAFFLDEVVEADVRELDISAVSGGDCEKILSRPHNAPGTDEKVVAHTTAHYPVDPIADVLASFPKGSPIALDVAALDGEQNQVGRGCILVSLDGSAGRSIDLELRALPKCQSVPARLDLMLVVDASQQAVIADPERHHIDLLRDTILAETAFLDGTSYGLVTFGPSDSVQVRVPSTPDRESVRIAVSELLNGHSGLPVLYDGVTKAARTLRTQAVCGKKPAMLLILGSGQAGSKLRPEDAQTAIYASVGDPSDDIYTFAIGLSQPAYDNLEYLLPPEFGIGNVTGAGSQTTREAAMREARDTLSALLLPPN